MHREGTAKRPAKEEWKLTEYAVGFQAVHDQFLYVYRKPIGYSLCHKPEFHPPLAEGCMVRHAEPRLGGTAVGPRGRRKLVVRIEFNIRYRWLLDLDLDGSAWDPTTFTKSGDRLPTLDIAKLEIPFLEERTLQRRGRQSSFGGVESAMGSPAHPRNVAPPAVGALPIGRASPRPISDAAPGDVLRGHAWI